MNQNGNFEDRLRAGLHDLAGEAEPPPTLTVAIGARLGLSAAPGHRQRRAVLMAIAAAIVVVAATLAVLAGRGGNHRNVAVLVPTTTTTATTDTTVPVLPVVTAPPASSTIDPATTATTAVIPSTATTPTTSRPTTTTTTTTSTTAPACSAAALRTTTATDQPSYASGTPVKITVTVQNISATTCQIPSPYPQTFASTIKITAVSNGTVVWAPIAAVNGILARPTPKVLAPQELYVWTTAMWDQHSCTAPCNTDGVGEVKNPVPAGAYQAQPNDGLSPPSPAAPTSFTIT